MPAYFVAACGASLTASSCSSTHLLTCLFALHNIALLWKYLHKQEAALYEYPITTHCHVPCPSSGNGLQRGAQSGQQTPHSTPIRFSSISARRSQVLLAPGSFGLTIVKAIPLIRRGECRRFHLLRAAWQAWAMKD